MMSFRTGIGLSVEEMWGALAALPGGPRMVPYGLGLRAPGAVPGLRARVRSVRVPTRVLLTAWSRWDRPRLDPWLRGTDVVHATNFVAGPSRRPTVVTVNDIGFVLEPSNADSVVGRFAAVLRRALARGAHVHVTTRHVACEVEEHFGPGLLAGGRIEVVPFGIPRLGSPPPLPGPGAGGPYVLAIGAQVQRKNLPRLVAAFARVATSHPDVRLVLAGPAGPDTPAVAAAVAALEPAVRTRVVLAGPVDAAGRAALMGQAAVLAYPSLYEGFGFPALEAMAAGVPVLAGRAGALPEVTGPAALLADPRDVDALAAGLDRLLGDTDLRDRLVAAGRLHSASFTWEATARGLDRLYTRLASSS